MARVHVIITFIVMWLFSWWFESRRRSATAHRVPRNVRESIPLRVERTPDVDVVMRHQAVTNEFPEHVIRLNDEARKVQFDTALRQYVVPDSAPLYAHSTEPGVLGGCGFVTKGFLLRFMHDESQWSDFIVSHEVRLCTAIVIPAPASSSRMEGTPLPNTGTYKLDTSDPLNWRWIAASGVVPPSATGANHHLIIDKDMRLYDPTVEQFNPNDDCSLVVVEVHGL